METRERKMNSDKGFTLMELIFVVAIIGLLASSAVPNYFTYQKKAKTVEAKLVLANIRTLEEIYWATGRSYGNLKNIGWVPPIGVTLYSYSVVAADADSFTAKAYDGQLDGDATLDVWTITHKGDLVHGTNDVAN